MALRHVGGPRALAQLDKRTACYPFWVQNLYFVAKMRLFVSKNATEWVQCTENGHRPVGGPGGDPGIARWAAPGVTRASPGGRPRG